jgi:threonine/homoserine/homoserine lactone efflux protein
LDNLAGIFVSSFLIALSGAIVPGPVLSVTISESAKGNFWAGPMIVSGHGVLEIVLIGLLAAGFADLINNTGLLSIIGIVGGGYLLCLALSMLKNVRTMTMEISEEPSVWGGPFVAGILTSLANPYWIIWWATIGLGYVLVSLKFGLIGLVIFFIGHILADFLWYSMVSLFFSKGRSFISIRAYRGIIGACAVMLIFFGVIFGGWGIQQLGLFGV